MIATGEQANNEVVVLLHGLAANRTIMWPLARWLRAGCSRVVNWGYSSLWARIETHGERLARFFETLDADEAVDRIHIVAHSMGGIVARLALADYMPAKVGRFVMLAPPNRGSHVATRLASTLGRLCPPIIQLRDCEGSFIHSLTSVGHIPVGIIAASHDAMVRCESTHLPCEDEADHIIVPGWHSSILWHAQTARQISHFLHEGHFLRGEFAHDEPPAKQPAAGALAESSGL
jgi:pimeloyl-ACP methyl ester carboxylesterase